MTKDDIDRKDFTTLRVLGEKYLAQVMMAVIVINA